MDVVYAMPLGRVSPTIAWMGTLCYAIQIYFDFSGYSDMAIGLGKMLGFDFKENFRHPYAAISMQDFWRRWHISLSSWFRDYVYIPLGGNRRGNVRTYVNLCIVFFLCGLWHGAAENFILWGLYHGFFLTFERMAKIDFGKHPLFGHLYVWAAMLFGWVLFRAESFEQITAFYSAMVRWAPTAVTSEYIWLWFTADVKIALAAGIILAFPVFSYIRRKIENRVGDDGTEGVAGTVVLVSRMALLAALFVLCVPLIIGDSYNPFIYFRF